MTSRHAADTVEGRTQASNVIAELRRREGESGIVTRPFPLNVNAPLFFPAVVHAAPDTMPVLPVPDASAAVVPELSLKEYAATRPVCAAAVAVLSCKTTRAANVERGTQRGYVRSIWRVSVMGWSQPGGRLRSSSQRLLRNDRQALF